VKRETALRRRQATLETLAEAVGAMKALSAHHLRMARSALAAARAYRGGIGDILASVNLAQQHPTWAAAPALVLVATDLGLCDGYNSQLVEKLLDERRRLEADTVYLVGRRPLAALHRAGVEPVRSYSAVTSVGGLTTLLLTLADDVLGDHVAGRSASVHVVSARFDGVGVWTPVLTLVLPIEPASAAAQPVRAPYASERHLARIAVREYLFSTLFGLLLDALAAEHGARLVATQAAEEWLDSSLRALEREITNLGREASTQEILDITTAARQRRRQVSPGDEGAAESTGPPAG
jgi:F-type H+-transporting ATPase subunit gamma